VDGHGGLRKPAVCWLQVDYSQLLVTVEYPINSC
jgi:hypothetical protein